mmetsp:Transcript_42962/g.68992  ORF Transcript_42962/g.68992 Transcript_42962/m.68992 type:complete len:486 (-) Transcript_42962:1563-3020(-)
MKVDFESNEAGWREALCAFHSGRVSADNCHAGLFGTVGEKKTFASRLAVVLKERIEDPWDQQVLVQGLQCAKFLLCDRDDAVSDLAETSTLSCYAIYAGPAYNGPVREESIKCLNNSMYESRENQSKFCGLAKDKGFGCLEFLLEQYKDWVNFHRACFISMFIVAGGQEPPDASISKILAQACISSVVQMAVFLKNPNERGVDFSTWPKDALNALTAGLQLIYAVGVSHREVLAYFEQESLENIQTLSEDELIKRVDTMTLEDPTIPYLDRLGLVLIQVLKADWNCTPELKNVKSHTLNLLMIACGMNQFAHFFYEQGAVESLVTTLKQRIATLHDESSTKLHTVQSFRELLPIVISFSELADKSSLAKAKIKEFFFSGTLPDLVNPTEKEGNDRKMEGNTPKDSLGGFMISLLTCIDSNLKRSTGELLYILCDNDAAEITERCGYGPAAHILAIKGGTIGGIIAQQDEDRRKRQQQQPQPDGKQ